MSTNDTTTPLTIKVPDYKPDTSMVTQYGMRYPDGTVKWTDDGASHNSVNFERLHNGNGSTAMQWADRLGNRARNANVDVEEYVAQHQPLKRTVIVVTTVSEEV